MFLRELCEARKNPHLNPKISINDAIVNRVNATTDVIGGTKNCFVSFTAIEKLGINPQSKYETPIGIYAYPGTYVVEKTGGAEGPMSWLPFAGNQPYANLFSVTGNIIDISDMSTSDAKDYYRKMVDICAKLSSDSWKSVADQVQQYIEESPTKALDRETVGGRFWYVSMMVARNIVGPSTGSKSPIAWNTLFRKIGIDGIVDPGYGIIHNAEPTQAVFFTKQVITDIDRVENKYSQYDLKLSAARRTQLQNAESKYEFIQIIEDDIGLADDDEIFAYLKKLPTDARIKVGLYLPYLLRNLNPTPNEAIKLYDHGVPYFRISEFADDKVLRHIVAKGDHRAIGEISRRKSLSPEMQELIFTINPDYAYHFRTPTNSIKRKMMAATGSEI